MNRRITILPALAFLFWSCTQNEPMTVVSWKTFSLPFDSLKNIETIADRACNFKELQTIFFADSLLKATFKRKNITGKHLEVSNYDISLSEVTFFDGDDFILCNLYHPDWPTNHRFIFSEKNGLVGFLPSHSGKKHYLLFKTVGKDTVYRLSIDLFTFLQQDTILNPPPPPMPKHIPVIEIEEEIDIDKKLLEGGKN